MMLTYMNYRNLIHFSIRKMKIINCSIYILVTVFF